MTRLQVLLHDLLHDPAHPPSAARRRHVPEKVRQRLEPVQAGGALQWPLYFILFYLVLVHPGDHLTTDSDGLL